MDFAVLRGRAWSIRTLMSLGAELTRHAEALEAAEAYGLEEVYQRLFGVRMMNAEGRFT